MSGQTPTLHGDALILFPALAIRLWIAHLLHWLVLSGLEGRSLLEVGHRMPACLPETGT